MNFAWVLSLTVGFLSLSQEILWVRVLGFALGGTPLAFAYVLALYLAGIALGARIGKQICASSANLWQAAALTLLLAAATDPLPPLLGPYIGIKHDGNSALQLVWPALAIVAMAGIKSVLFPIAHHLGSQQSGQRVGTSVSRVYFGNIIGSALGPLVTGYVLLDILSVDRCFQLTGMLSLLMALCCAMRAGIALKSFACWSAAIVASWVPVFSHSDFINNAAQRWFALNGETGTYGQVVHSISNRHGAIHTVAVPGRSDDIIYGGNMFDGRMSVDLRHDTNGISRVYILAGLHPQPKRILVIGLSGGAWTRALTGFAGMERIDAIEINAGYLELIRRYPVVAPILSDPRVHIHIDDGRRWLQRRPAERFDLIVMNTTLHYRAYSSNLLSHEFMEELKRHLLPGGIVAYNTTGSLDAAWTTRNVFRHTLRHGNFLYAADVPLSSTPDVARTRLAALTMDGKPLLAEAEFTGQGAGAALLAKVTGLQTVDALFDKGPGDARTITDANMLPEYRHGQTLNVPPLSWLLPPKAETRF